MATAIRIIVVLIFAWLMVFVTGAEAGISNISSRTLLFLVLSGLATGASWLCFFHALQKGDVNKVVPIDKSSTILTILLALIFLQEGLSLGKGVGIVLIGVGTMLMITRKGMANQEKSSDGSCLFTQSFPQYLPVLPQYLERQVSKELILILVQPFVQLLSLSWRGLWFL